jgi:nucleotide-binding universal stress UspA family protein
MPGIIVGVDGSSNAHTALDWAMREAAIRHAALTVLTVHEVMASAWTSQPVILGPDADAVRQYRTAAQEAVAKVASEIGESQPASVTVEAVNGVVAQELINASREADLLVVGSRGVGGFASLLLGSVTTKVVQHASCPVVTVPSSR